MKNLLLSFLMLFSFGASATAPKEAFTLVKQGKAVLVDVREADEVKEGMLKGAVWLPTSKINANEEWLKDFRATTQDKKIFLYCRSGNRSGKFQALLKGKGIESENLGGYQALKAEEL